MPPLIRSASLKPDLTIFGRKSFLIRTTERKARPKGKRKKRRQQILLFFHLLHKANETTDSHDPSDGWEIITLDDQVPSLLLSSSPSSPFKIKNNDLRPKTNLKENWNKDEFT